MSRRSPANPSRRTFLQGSSAAILATTLEHAQESASRPAQGRTTSILLVGWDDVSFAEAVPAICPRLAAFRTEALESVNCWSHPVCSQSRGAILYGAWGKKLGTIGDLHRGPGRPPAGWPTIPGVLAAAGWATALVGKWHCGNSWYGRPRELVPLERGYGQWLAGSWHNLEAYDDWERMDVDAAGGTIDPHHRRYATLAQVAAAESWWRAHASGPRFLHVGLNAPHAPHHVPPAELLAGYRAPGPNAPHRQKFLAMLRSADTAFGKLLDLVGPSTAVLLYSDNGTNPQAASAEQDRDKMKGTTFALGTHVLYFERSATSPAGPDRRLMHLVDIGAGILALAGCRQPPEWDGRVGGRASVLSEAKGMLLANSPPGGLTDRAARTNSHLLRQFGPTGKPYTEELYDLAADPGETTPVDLADPAHSGALAHLRNELAAAALP